MGPPESELLARGGRSSSVPGLCCLSVLLRGELFFCDDGLVPLSGAHAREERAPLSGRSNLQSVLGELSNSCSRSSGGAWFSVDSNVFVNNTLVNVVLHSRSCQCSSQSFFSQSESKPRSALHFRNVGKIVVCSQILARNFDEIFSTGSSTKEPVLIMNLSPVLVLSFSVLFLALAPVPQCAVAQDEDRPLSGDDVEPGPRNIPASLLAIGKNVEQMTTSSAYKKDLVRFFSDSASPHSPESQTLLELGCRYGYTTRVFAHLFGHVICVEREAAVSKEFLKDMLQNGSHPASGYDHDDSSTTPHSNPKNAYAVALASKITLINSDLYGESWRSFAGVNDIHVVHIDAAHDTKSVLADVLSATGGGIRCCVKFLVLHDLDLEGVQAGLGYLEKTGVGKVVAWIGEENWRGSGRREGAVVEVRRNGGGGGGESAVLREAAALDVLREQMVRMKAYFVHPVGVGGGSVHSEGSVRRASVFASGLRLATDSGVCAAVAHRFLSTTGREGVGRSREGAEGGDRDAEEGRRWSWSDALVLEHPNLNLNFYIGFYPGGVATVILGICVVRRRTAQRTRSFIFGSACVREARWEFVEAFPRPKMRLVLESERVPGTGFEDIIFRSRAGGGDQPTAEQVTSLLGGPVSKIALCDQPTAEKVNAGSALLRDGIFQQEVVSEQVAEQGQSWAEQEQEGEQHQQQGRTGSNNVGANVSGEDQIPLVECGRELSGTSGVSGSVTGSFGETEREMEGISDSESEATFDEAFYFEALTYELIFDAGLQSCRISKGGEWVGVATSNLVPPAALDRANRRFEEDYYRNG